MEEIMRNVVLIEIFLKTSRKSMDICKKETQLIIVSHWIMCRKNLPFK